MDRSLLEHDLRLMMEAIERAGKMGPSAQECAQVMQKLVKMTKQSYDISLAERVQRYNAAADRHVAELLARDRE